MMASTGLIAQRLAIVTGAGSGIGRAVCQVFASEGAKIIAADVNEKANQETISCLPQPEIHSSVTVDVSSNSSIQSLMKFVKEKYSESPSIIVNCAGVTRDNFILNMTEEEFDQVVNIHLKGTFLMIKATSASMIASGIKNGSIVNFGSIVGKVGNMGQCNYAAAKAGIGNLTKTAAKELAKHNIRCNAIIPGFIDTPMVQTVPEKVLNQLLSQIPMRRMGQPKEVAEACLFLASDKSSFITGEELEVTGGLFM